MNIWLPIVTNIVIAMILIAGLLIGKKNGFKVEFSKFILTCGSVVGSYFLAPILGKLVSKIEMISVFTSTELGIKAINSICLLITFIVLYLIVCLIGLVIKKITSKNSNTVNIARSTKIKGLDKKTAKALRKDEKRLRKLNKKQNYSVSKVSQVFGAIFGILIALIVGFMIATPIKYTTQLVTEINPSLTEILTTHEYTIYGQLDKIVDLSSLIIKD